LIPLLGRYLTGLKSMEGSQDTSIREGFTGFWEEMVIGIERPVWPINITTHWPLSWDSLPE